MRKTPNNKQLMNVRTWWCHEPDLCTFRLIVCNKLFENVWSVKRIWTALSDSWQSHEITIFGSIISKTYFELRSFIEIESGHSISYLLLRLLWVRLRITQKIHNKKTNCSGFPVLPMQSAMNECFLDITDVTNCLLSLAAMYMIHKDTSTDSRSLEFHGNTYNR